MKGYAEPTMREIHELILASLALSGKVEQKRTLCASARHRAGPWWVTGRHARFYMLRG